MSCGSCFGADIYPSSLNLVWVVLYLNEVYNLRTRQTEQESTT